MAASEGAQKPEVWFYHLRTSALEAALPRLIERALAGGARVVVRTASVERLDALNRAFWTYDPGSFLAHGGPDDGAGAEQPVYLTTGRDNPNGAGVLVLVDGVEPQNLDGYGRCLDMFDGGDAEALEAARRRWQALKDQGYALSYWQQGEDGRWQQRD